MKVADVMSKQVDHVSRNTPVKDVCRIIFGRGINGVPVLEGKKIVGFITEKDVIAKFYPSIQEYVEDPVNMADFEKMEGKANEVFRMHADKIMSKNPVTVSPETPLLRAQSLMFIHKVGRLPVVSGNGNLVGILSKGDIFGALVGDRIFFTEDQDYNDWLSKTYYASVDIENRMKHEMPDLLKVFSKNKVKKVIDIGCGTGDHAIELARRGFTVVGTDRSDAMIEEANKRRAKLPKALVKKVNFYRGETASILGKLNETFDAAIFMGNTISHNPGYVATLIKKTADHLSKNGIIILQITNFDKVLKVQKRLLNFSLAKLAGEIGKEYAFLEFYDLPNLREKTLLKTFAILRASNNRWKWVGVRNRTMAYTTKISIKDILKKSGFSKVSLYGGKFDGRNWNYLFREEFKPLESDWLNVVAKR